jgi:isopentenyl phosphate kinase
MARLIYLKLSGKLMSDTNERFMLRREVVVRLAQEVAEVQACQPNLQLVLGHGAGAFGRNAMQSSGIEGQAGHQPAAALAAISAATAALNAAVRAIFLEAGVPVVSLAPSASAFVEDGRLTRWALAPVDHLLTWGAVPLVYEDMVLSDSGEVRLLSVETLFQELAAHRTPERIILLEDLEQASFDEYQDDVELSLFPDQHVGRHWPPMQMTWDDGRLGDGRHDPSQARSELLTLIKAWPEIPVHLVNGMQPGIVAQFLGEHAGSRVGVTRRG